MSRNSLDTEGLRAEHVSSRAGLGTHRPGSIRATQGQTKEECGGQDMWGHKSSGKQFGGQILFIPHPHGVTFS